jgi:hypothetical protein
MRGINGTFAVDKTDYSITDTGAVLDPDVAFCQGAEIFMLDESTTTVSTVGANSSLAPATGVFDIALNGSAGQETGLIIGDNNLYTERGVYSLDNGKLLHLFPTPIDGAFALSGQYLWGVISGELVAHPVGLRGGEVWHHKSGGDDETIGRSDATLRLLIRE